MHPASSAARYKIDLFIFMSYLASGVGVGEGVGAGVAVFTAPPGPTVLSDFSERPDLLSGFNSSAFIFSEHPKLAAKTAASAKTLVFIAC